MIRIIDLDNCIANDEWRIHHIDWTKESPDERYAKYHALAINDELCNQQLLDTEHDIVILTARPECYRDATLAWLKSKDINCFLLLMRPEGNHMHSLELKQDQMHWVAAMYGGKDQIADAFDDRPDVVEMYRKHGIEAYQIKIHDTCAYTAPSDRKLSVPEILRSAAQTYDERNRVYGDTYKNFGGVMVGMFPDGITLKSSDDWNRIGLMVMAAGKLTRYAAQFDNGGHKDSAHDLINYAAMLEELTK